MALHLKIITPLRTALETEVTSILVPAAEGEMEVLPGHADIIAAIANGELVYRAPGKPAGSLFIGGGFLQVNKEEVLLVTDTALEAGEIDPNSVQEAIDRAQNALRNQSSVLSREEQAYLEAVLSKQLAMLDYKRTKRH